MINKIFIIIIFIVIGCKSHIDNRVKLLKYSFKDLNGWANDKHIEALNSFNNSCSKFVVYYKNRKISNYFDAGRSIDWEKICIKAKSIDKAFAKEFFENNFNVYLVQDKNEQYGLFTGYYEPYINGSYQKSDKYKYPIYRAPDNINNIKHYLERKTINNGFLRGRNLEMLYTDNEVDLFFLHIQGSGIVRFENGEFIRIGYKAQNGHKYFPIGKYFINNLKIDKNLINANFLKEYLYNNKAAREIMELNPSYVFFEIKDNIYGAYGSILTAERSIAIDNQYIPYGAPIWLETNYPKIENNNIKPFNKLLIAQDTGGAIRGIIRGDIFYGNDEYAIDYASNMKEKGRYFIFLPKEN